MGVRRRGRVIAFQTLYRHQMSKVPLEELLEFSWMGEERLGKLQAESMDFANLLIRGTLENRQRIDDVINEQVEHWDFSRLAKVDLAILRVSVYCLLYQQDIPLTVTIDEAVDIAKQFGSTDSYRFVNGVLDGIRKQHCI